MVPSKYSEKNTAKETLSICSSTEQQRESRVGFFTKQKYPLLLLAASILKWTEAAGLDNTQKRAFEVVTAAFRLTFYEEAISTDEQPSRTQATYRNERNQLRMLANKRNEKDNQLICFLHGGGGSGKSTVINLLRQYAREYCDLLGHPFTCRTIVVTAMSGVAATLIHGETAHSALYLNRKSEITEEQKRVWADTRLVIIDEISFATAKDFKMIDETLRKLTGKLFENFGGLNIVFAGDMRQLEPVKGEPVYNSYCHQFHGMLNCYIELTGMHRFKSDPEWGERLNRFRKETYGS
jgi:hypothetical protein